MTFKTKLALAVGIAAIAMPATAQRLGQNRPNDAKPQELSTTPDGATTTTATTTTGRKIVISKEAQKAIVAYQTAVNNNDTANQPALLAEAQKVAKTSDDKFFIATNQTKAAIAANNLDGIRAGVDAMQASGGADNADLALRYADLGNRMIKANRAAEGAAALEKSISIDGSNPTALTLLADAKAKSGDKPAAIALMQKSFAASAAKGQKVAENNYKFAAGMAFDAKSPAALGISRSWAEAYPNADSWRAAVQIYRGINQPRGQQLIDMWRLARANKALRSEADYDSYLGALVTAGNLAEAKAVLAEAGQTPGVDLTKTQFKAHAAKAAAAPARAAIDAKAKAAATGAAMIDAGDAYYGVGAYAEAAAQYQAALAKGGDANVANLHLGMALARSGDKAGAAAALAKVTGPNAEIAKYWAAYAASRA